MVQAHCRVLQERRGTAEKPEMETGRLGSAVNKTKLFGDLERRVVVDALVCVRGSVDQ
jgi:hypothetical protein